MQARNDSKISQLFSGRHLKSIVRKLNLKALIENSYVSNNFVILKELILLFKIRDVSSLARLERVRIVIFLSLTKEKISQYVNNYERVN